MNEKVAEEKVADETIETALITEDEINKFRQSFNNVLSTRQLDRMNDYQAQKEYNSFLKYIEEEISKLDDPVTTELFNLQADIYKAMYMPPPRR
jgi:C-terminal processing protease CtpA/Prc